MSYEYDRIKEYTIMALITTFIIGLVLLMVSMAESCQVNDIKYVRAILGEAEGEGELGMLAVACGIQNRPEKLVGVHGREPRPYVLKEYYTQAKIAWYRAQYASECAFLGGADMWCSNVEQCREAWAGVPMHYITKIGNHHFYRRITTNE